MAGAEVVVHGAVVLEGPGVRRLEHCERLRAEAGGGSASVAEAAYAYGQMGRFGSCYSVGLPSRRRRGTRFCLLDRVLALHCGAASSQAVQRRPQLRALESDSVEGFRCQSLFHFERRLLVQRDHSMIVCLRESAQTCHVLDECTDVDTVHRQPRALTLFIVITEHNSPLTPKELWFVTDETPAGTVELTRKRLSVVQNVQSRR